MYSASSSNSTRNSVRKRAGSPGRGPCWMKRSPIGAVAHAASSSLPSMWSAFGVRAAAIGIRQRDGDVALPGKVELAEISGSDTFVHLHTPIGNLVAQLTGVHVFQLGTSVTLYIHPAQAYVFGADEKLLVAASDV